MSQPACLCIATGLCSVALWSPVISLAGLFLYLGITSFGTFPACERPLAIWALAGGSAFAGSVIVWLAGAAVALASRTCCARDTGKLRGQHPSRLAQTFLGRPAFEALASLRSSPTTWAAVERSLFAVLVLAVGAWLVVGAVWVWPLHDAAHHCSPVLVSVSFYVTVGLVIVLVAVACVASIFCTCLSICGLGFRSAIDGIVEIVHGLLTLGEEPELRGLSEGGGAEDGLGRFAPTALFGLPDGAAAPAEAAPAPVEEEAPPAGETDGLLESSAETASQRGRGILRTR